MYILCLIIFLLSKENPLLHQVSSKNMLTDSLLFLEFLTYISFLRTSLQFLLLLLNFNAAKTNVGFLSNYYIWWFSSFLVVANNFLLNTRDAIWQSNFENQNIISKKDVEIIFQDKYKQTGWLAYHNRNLNSF